jgi:heptaprenyl diphosphate synthase
MTDSTQQRGDGVSRNLVLLGAFCLFLSALEHLIPKPLPFMRLGLANLPLLLALDIFPVKHFFLLVLIKVLGQGLVTGTLFSYVALFSFAGTVLSASVMLFLRRIVKKNSFIGISIAGAFVSNAAQLVLARYIVFGEGVIFLAPPFLAAGIITGGFFGFFADKFSAQSKWVSLKRKGASAAVAAGTADTAELSAAAVPAVGIQRGAFSLLRGIALLFAIGFFLSESRLYVRAALFALFWFLAMITGKKTRPLFTLISIVMIVLCNLFPPYGKIIFSFGSFIITEENILRGLQRAVTLEGLVMFSRIAISANLPLPGTIGRLLRETFAVLESLNKNFSVKKKESLFQKLDRLLCEASGY